MMRSLLHWSALTTRIAAVVITIGSCAATLNAWQSPRPIGVYIFTAQPVATLVPFDLKAREESVSHLERSLRGKLPKQISALAANRESADVLVEVMGRTKNGDDVTVHFRVYAAGETLSVDGLNDDDHWNDAANDAAKRIAEFVKVNQDRIRSKRSN